MDHPETSGGIATVRLTADELMMRLNAINETLEAAEDWELNARAGADRGEFRALHADLCLVADSLR
ncbi:MAG: hypothetical protein ACYTGG_10935 [Planctomycetota bacterium]|jgi:hypothetical protein